MYLWHSALPPLTTNMEEYLHCAFDTVLSCLEYLSRADVNTVPLLLFVLFLLYYCQSRSVLVNIPPGPKPLPVVGNFGVFLIPSFIRRRLCPTRRTDKPPVVALTEQAKVYGNVFSLFVGSQLVVVLNGYDVVRDALSNNPEVFSDRPDIPLVTIMTKRKGERSANCRGNMSQTATCCPVLKD